MICGQNASMLQRLYHTAGLKTRLYNPGGHVLCEVFYDDAWHVLDIDMWTWFRNSQGQIASAFELASNPQDLILNNQDKSDPCNLPDRSLETYAKMYEGCPRDENDITPVDPHWSIRAHCMDFHLRPGETLIRSQEAKGYFHLGKNWLPLLKKHASEWHGFPIERFEPFRSYGNGRWIYTPNLSADYADFSEAAFSSDLTQNADGLVGPGSATIKIASPYLFCGKPEINGVTACHRNGCWIEASGDGSVSIEVSNAAGEWVPVLEAKNSFDEKKDISDTLSGRYNCLIRVQLGEHSSLNCFNFDGRILTAPMSLPRLETGDNELTIQTGDQFGLNTVPCPDWVDFRKDTAMSQHWESADNATVKAAGEHWQKIAPKEQGPVSVVWKFSAPGDKAFAWAYVHATVKEGPRNEVQKNARLEWRTGDTDWQTLTSNKITNTEKAWDSTLDADLRIEKPAHSVWIRLTSDTAISGMEWHGHTLEADNEDPLEVVHHWQENEKECSFTAPSGKTAYLINCGKNPQNHSISMQVPSRKLLN